MIDDEFERRNPENMQINQINQRKNQKTLIIIKNPNKFMNKTFLSKSEIIPRCQGYNLLFEYLKDIF